MISLKRSTRKLIFTIRSFSNFFRKESLFLFLFFMVIFLSCKEKLTNISSKDPIKIDTLIFGSKDEIIELGENGEFLISSALSENGSHYFIFNLEKRYLYTLDLKTKTLLSKLKLPSEGPDGIGDWLIDFQMINDSSFIAQGDNAFYFFNKTGKSKNKTRVDHIFFLNDTLAQKYSNAGFLYKNEQFYFTTGEIGSIQSEVLNYDPKDDSYKLNKIPFLDIIKNWALVSKVKSYTFFSSPAFVISNFPNGIILVNRGLPDMIAYLDNGETVTSKPNSSRFFADVKPIKEIYHAKSAEDEKEFKRELENQINFLRPVLNEGKKKLFRLGYRLSSDGESYENYLFEYDLNLNLTQEQFLDGIYIKPKKLFLRDSKFYLAASFNDEPGFLIFENPFKE